ncbi:retrovirus-related pol polyprotein LINE-1 [Tanacetum coccineum]
MKEVKPLRTKRRLRKVGESIFPFFSSRDILRHVTREKQSRRTGPNPYRSLERPWGQGNYRGIKLLGHTMKLWKRVIERRLQRETKVSENQFSFMPGRSSVEAIHLIRKLMEKYMERQRDLDLAFLDLEKAYDSVQRDDLKDLNRQRNAKEIY